VAADAIAAGSRDEVLAYAARPALVVTGSQVRTVVTPEAPAVSQVVLDMGTSVPMALDWPPNQPVHGQLPWAGHVVYLPRRGPEGSLTLSPVLVPYAADTHAGPLPATRGNVIRQACKFLGDRYGWGHDFESRDCSGLVVDVYRSLGLLLPRNTADQAQSPALDRTLLPSSLSRAERLAQVASLAPGDLIYAPRHVMMLLGHDPDPWIIHATHGGGSQAVNGVVITPLAEVTAEDGKPIIDAATTLVRVLPPFAMLGEAP
jgi:cell wall-associated NlpC family hydrolase